MEKKFIDTPTLRMTKHHWLTIIAACFYLIVAYQSSGFHNLDEHFQIIEFANYKLDLLERQELAWEFDAQIRPGLQPAICFLLFKLSKWLGITDVYLLAFILRAVTAVLAVIVINRFIAFSTHQIERKLVFAYALISYFLWFLPYINVRFSSEAWSGLFFLLAIAIIQHNLSRDRSRNILLGAVLGIAVVFRYQTALLALGAGLWLIFAAKLRLSEIVTIALSSLVVLFIGFFVDWWFYGEISFTLFNYFYVNIIEDVASNYGVSPWYEIILYIINGPGPVGILILLAFLFLLIHQPRHLILWASLPFLLAHIVIPHKELRFLFPLVNLVPLLLIVSYQQLAMLMNIGKRNRFLQKTIFAVFVLTNIAGLIVIVSKGAGDTKVSVTEYIHRHYYGKKINVLYVNGLTPYYDWRNLKNTFYNSNEVVLAPIVTVWQDDFLKKKRKGYTNLLIISNSEITGPKTIERLKKLNLVRVYQSIPEIVQKIIAIYDESLNNDNLILYEFVN